MNGQKMSFDPLIGLLNLDLSNPSVSVQTRNHEESVDKIPFPYPKLHTNISSIIHIFWSEPSSCLKYIGPM